MTQARRPTVVVVGTGMAGARAVEELLARDPDRFSIRMFGDEPHGTYNRILLSGVLSGHVDPEQLWLNPLDWYRQKGVFVHAGVRADRIDPRLRVVSGAAGKVIEPYDHLVLATGSRPFVPPVEGTRQEGVFVFRTLEDCAAIGSYAAQCDRAVVLGGGLLGLEAARGLLDHEVEVTVIEAAPHLMPQQLDPAGAGLLRHKMEQMGVTVLLNKGVSALTGDGRVNGVRFADGSTLEADMVVISCGIRPNVAEAQAAGLLVERGIVVDDQMRTSEEGIYAVGECAQHRGVCYGVVEPLYEQARVLADVLHGDEAAAYRGSKLSTTLKVMGVELTSMGDVRGEGPGTEVVSHLDPEAGVYRKLVVRQGRLDGAILLGAPDPNGLFRRLFKGGDPLPDAPLALIAGGAERAGMPGAVGDLPDTAEVCNCNMVCKGALVDAIKAGCNSVTALGEKTKAGTGCGTCQPLLNELIQLHGDRKAPSRPNPIELLKAEKNGLDALEDIHRLAANNNWQEMSEDDKQRAKWYGLFFRKQTPGNFMLRVRLNAGRSSAAQFRVLADLSDEFGRGFCDLTTRQQVQLRWFTLADVPEIWRRLEAVGLHSMQTGLDNVRGVCGCPLGGDTPHELVDATSVIDEFNEMLIGNREFTNLPRKFNVTITGCLENCCHVETQDIGLVPAYRELDGRQVNGFNVLVGGKQGSGGYKPAVPLDVFVRPEDAARVCREITLIFRDNGDRTQRTRARLAFLIQDRGVAWLRGEVEKRMKSPGMPRLLRAGTDMRKTHHTDHLGIHPQKSHGGVERYSAGLLVPVGRITTAQMRGVADLAERYGDGGVRLTVQQNVVLTGIPAARVGAFSEEPLLKELSPDPSPIMRGLVSCTGIDYCHMALIETKGWALEVARELERRTAGHKIQPLTIHWSGCAAGCGMHGVSTIGLQGCRSRVNGQIVDAAHVSVKGQTGPEPAVGPDLMYDVPCEQLADALLPLVKHLPRK